MGCRKNEPIYGLIRMANGVFLGELEFKQGERFDRGGLIAEILELDAAQLPSRVAFRFNAPLDSPTFHWLQFNFQTCSQEPFAVPAIGQRASTLAVSSPDRLSPGPDHKQTKFRTSV